MKLSLLKWTCNLLIPIFCNNSWRILGAILARRSCYIAKKAVYSTVEFSEVERIQNISEPIHLSTSCVESRDVWSMIWDASPIIVTNIVIPLLNIVIILVVSIAGRGMVDSWWVWNSSSWMGWMSGCVRGPAIRHKQGQTVLIVKRASQILWDAQREFLGFFMSF